MSEQRIVFCSAHEVGWFLARDLMENGLQLRAFVTLTAEHAKRQQVAGYRDLTDLARQYGVPVYHAESYSLKAEADEKYFMENRFDLLLQGGWQRLFPETILSAIRLGAVGIHGSPDYLPKGRGRSPLNWALIEGKRRFILQLFLMQAGADDGPVFDSEAFDVNQFDTIRTLYYKNAILTRRMLLRSIPALLEGRLHLRPQVGEPSHYPKRAPEDGRIYWEEMDVWQIYNFVRAQTRPYPGAFGVLDGADHRIWRAAVFDTRITYPEAGYGQIVERFDAQLVVNCRGGLLLIDDYERM